MPDPVRELVHSHATLSKRLMGIRDLLQAGVREADADRAELSRAFDGLREDLLRHFADEDEGLFPFVKRALPDRAAAVDRLAAEHDAICRTVVLLAQRAQQASGTPGTRQAALVALYAEFEDAYAAHSGAEARLFDDLLASLDAAQRVELSGILEHL